MPLAEATWSRLELENFFVLNLSAVTAYLCTLKVVLYYIPRILSYSKLIFALYVISNCLAFAV